MPCFSHSSILVERDGLGAAGSDVARVNDQPEAAIATSAAEWDLSGQTSTQVLKEVPAVGAERSGFAAVLAVECALGCIAMMFGIRFLGSQNGDPPLALQSL